MLNSLTATGVVGSATTWGSEISTPLIVIIGFTVALLVAGWAIARFRRGGGKGSRRRKRKK
ncbi:MAG: hypothetical protein U1E26_12815 [Coriobacteriia bacterium]|nr:hypothetical protein [Coriobacteriia bacterium]